MTREWERAYAEAYPDRLADYVDGQVPDGGVTDEPEVDGFDALIASIAVSLKRIADALEVTDEMRKAFIKGYDECYDSHFDSLAAGIRAAMEAAQ